MEDEIGFLCNFCNKEYTIETRDFRCPCGGPFKLNWTPKPFPISHLSERRRSIWRYRESIPIMVDDNIISLDEGFTPLIPFSYGDFKNILLKLDYLCPSGSYKDRGASVLISSGGGDCVRQSRRRKGDFGNRPSDRGMFRNRLGERNHRGVERAGTEGNLR